MFIVVFLGGGDSYEEGITQVEQQRELQPKPSNPCNGKKFSCRPLAAGRLFVVSGVHMPNADARDIKTAAPLLLPALYQVFRRARQSWTTLFA